MVPSYFKIEILAWRDEFVTHGRKGLMKFEYLNMQKCQKFFAFKRSAKIRYNNRYILNLF